jgi:hypothetical protein
MIATFKETITSLQDNKYGQVIIGKSFKSVLWYWTKYLLLISIFPLVLVISLLTRYLPQAPKFILDNFPEGTLTVKDSQLSSTINQPYKLGDSNFSVILDTGGNLSELDSVQSGVLFLKDKLVTKSPESQIQTQTYGRLPDFSLDKFQLADWITQNRSRLWFGGLVLILVAAVLISAAVWSGYLLGFVIWALVFWLVGKYLLKKVLTYVQCLNIVIYAQVLPLILSFILSFAPNQILDYMRLLIFFYFGFSWIWNLPGTEVPTPAPLTEKPVPVLPSKPRKRGIHP